MTITIEAVYENGVLKPAKPLPLSEHERVQVTIVPAEDPLEAVIGICDEGPDMSIADRHDDIIYGPTRPENGQP